MRNNVILIIAVVLILPALMFGQMEKMLFDFENVLPTPSEGDSTYWLVSHGVNASWDSCYTHLTYVNDPVSQGDSALHVDYMIQRSESYGGDAKFMHWHPDSGGVYDLSGYDTLAFDYYISEQQSEEGAVHFRFNLTEVSAVSDSTYDAGAAEYFYSFNYILDNEVGWHTHKIPLIEGAGAGDPGFTNTGWYGIAGDGSLDLSKIKAFHFEYSIGGTNDRTVSQGSMVFDNIRLTDPQKINLLFFNGENISGTVDVSPGWSDGTYEVTDEEDNPETEGTHSIKWGTPTPSWALYDGLVFTLQQPKNLAMNWMADDSLKFSIKAEAGLDTLKLVLADDDQDETLSYEAFYMLSEEEVGYDGEWKDVSLALSDFDRDGGGYDADIGGMVYDDMMDSTKFKYLKILVGTGNGLSKTVYLDNIWIGNPELDLTGTDAVSGVTAQHYSTEATNYNLVMWQDLDNETGESYNVYASREEITDVTAPNVELIASKVPEGTQTAIHYLRYPLEDHDVDFYYGVVAIDQAGNDGPPGTSGKITSLAKGVPTISLNVPSGFEVDGFLDEWYDSDIMPWVLKPENNNVAFGEVTDSTDLKGTIYLAIDDDYLYAAGEIVDDVYHFSTNAEWWNYDAFEFFIGLYNQQGSKHNANLRGEEPDYKLQFHENGVVNEYIGNIIDDPEYFYFEGLDPDYVFEAKLPLDSIAGPDDSRFHPNNGMKIPVELYLHDNDGGGDAMEGTLGWSPLNADNAWQSPQVWAYTFIGDQYTTSIDNNQTNNVVHTFELNQNYPNPFNPTTTIQYTLPASNKVKLTVYNMIGQQVDQLVNEVQKAGVYKVEWNAIDMPSGVYFYRINTGQNVETRKMLLLK
ncbi:MAG: T9SS type A sorting domain-containing protein [Candidatus Marinimicrobia bacterium]|nr:T9SS type A sorting domain-containing protein [Candidatus Neomarinimicrobiota bacterium]